MSTADRHDAAGTTGAASDTADRDGAITHLQGAKVTDATAQDEGRPNPARLSTAQVAVLVRQDLDRAISDGAITLPPGAKVTVHTEFKAMARDGEHLGVSCLIFTIQGAPEQWAYADEAEPVLGQEMRRPSQAALELGERLLVLGMTHRSPSRAFIHRARLEGGPLLATN